MNEFKFTVTAKVKKIGGDKVDREEIAEEIRLHLEDDSNPETVYPLDAEYEITSWTVVEGA